MKGRNKINCVNITVLLIISVLFGTATLIFGQPRIEDFYSNSAADTNRAITMKSEGTNSFGQPRSTMIIGTNKGEAKYETINVNDSLATIRLKPFTLNPKTSGLVRGIDFTFDARGYLLTSSGIYYSNPNSIIWNRMKTDFTNNADSIAELWGISFVNRTGKACIAGVYFVKDSDDIEKELLLCTENIFENEPVWDEPNINRNEQTEKIQLTNIYFNNNQGWAVGTDGVEGVVWSSINGGNDWENENVSMIKEPLLSVTGTGNKVFVVGYNGTVFSKEVAVKSVTGGIPSEGINDGKIRQGDIVQIKGGILGNILSGLPGIGNLSEITEVIGIVDKVRNNGMLKITITRVSPTGLLEIVRKEFKGKEIDSSQVIRIGSAKSPQKKLNDDESGGDESKNNEDSKNTVSSQWKVVPVSNKQTLRSIKFSDDGKIGFIVGNKGTILYSKDSGNSWKNVQLAPNLTGKQSDIAKTDFYSIFIDTSYCWVVGSNGTIVKINIIDMEKEKNQDKEKNKNKVIFTGN